MNIKRKIKKWMAVFAAVMLFAAGLAAINADSIYAADSVSAKITSHTVKIGDTVTVTVTLSSNSEMGAQDIYVSYDAQVLELVTGGDISGGGGNARWIGTDTKKSVSFTLEFKTLKVGKSTVSINTTASVISDMDEQRMNINATAGSVTVNAPVSYSADNTLKSLSISPGALTPAFASSIYDYTVSVGENDTRLTVSAVANHSSAKVSVTGNTDLKPGSNTVTIMVTAENGERRNYTIKVNKPVPETTAPEPVVNKTATIDGVNYEIIEDYSSRPLPDNFAPTEVDYNGQTVTAGKHSGNGITIMYLQAVDDNGKSGFYVYDTVSKTFSPYIVLGASQLNYVVLSISDSMEKPDGYSLADVTINDMAVKVLKNGNDDFYLFYGMNSEGSTGWYSYDTKENTVQRYVGASVTDNNGETQVSNESSSDSIISEGGVWKILAVIMTVIAIVMVIITASFIAKNRKLVASNARVSDLFDDKTAVNDTVDHDAKTAASGNGAAAGDSTSENASENRQDNDDELEEFEDKDILLDDDVLEVSEISEISEISETPETMDIPETAGQTKEPEVVELSDVQDVQEISLENPDDTENSEKEEIYKEEISLEEVGLDNQSDNSDVSEVEVIEFDDVK